MVTYVVLFNFTEQGIKSVKESGNRAKAAATALKGMGGRFIGIWWLVGQYGVVILAEAPDDQTVARFTYGNRDARQHSHRPRCAPLAREEIGSIVGGLP